MTDSLPATLREAYEARALQALDQLGTTSAAVAVKLTDLGIRGTPGECATCPIARYLLRTLSDVRTVIADWVDIEVLFADDTAVNISTPDPVKEFILEFDQGRFGHLVGAP